jgi:REP element-mobilizing transposase RayT
MPNTYTQIYIHIVFSVKGRANLISSVWKERLYQYISGIIRANNQKTMIINGVSDHIHILIGMNATCSISELVRDIKSNSSKWINDMRFIRTKFEWQTGFGAFSVSPHFISTIINYIQKQEEHHRKKSFREEYVAFLKDANIEYNENYLLEDFGENTEAGPSPQNH